MKVCIGLLQGAILIPILTTDVDICVLMQKVQRSRYFDLTALYFFFPCGSSLTTLREKCPY